VRWGVALTVGPNYNLPMMAEPRAAVAWEALLQAQRHAGGTTPVEQALIAALAQRNQGSGPLDPSNEGPVLVAYAQSMKTVAERFPADFAMGHVARPVRLAGAPGLGGRGDEASPDPGKAVPAAERLPGMMPAPGPLEHMPAHIRRLIEVPRALVIYVRGQSHGRGAGISSPGFNLQADYINFWLKFVGVNEVKTLMVEHTWDAKAQETIEQGKAQAIAMAFDF
jgi:hypothetical protein